MKSASDALKNLLFSDQGFVFVDLYTFTLSSGAVLRYTAGERLLVNAGLTFGRGPGIDDSGVGQSRGVQVDTVDVTIRDDGHALVGGVPLLTFIKTNGFDGALARIDRAFAPDWETMHGSGPVGSYIRFLGRFSEVKSAFKTYVVISLATPIELLDVQMPTEVYQASCLNALFDAHCTLSASAFRVGGVVAAGSTQQVVASDITAAAGVYSLGTVVFLTGANAGARKTIKSQDASGNLTLVSPLAVAPAAGDTFNVLPGCDLSMATCANKFSNLVNFRGQPFIPTPETAV